MISSIKQQKPARPQPKFERALSLIIEKGFGLPDDDEDLLVKALDHDQDQIVIQALEQLRAVLLDNNTSKNPGLLKSRIQSAQNDCL